MKANRNTLIAWQITLPVYILFCVVSLFIRFRRADRIQREQIKWLFFAAALFAASYIPAFFNQGELGFDTIWYLFFIGGVVMVPTGIAIAILRYHLWDIDVIIRRTLQYTLLTGLLALLYFGSLIVLQSIVEQVLGSESPVVIVVSTLGIAALFNPLRIRCRALSTAVSIAPAMMPRRSWLSLPPQPATKSTW
jgi:cytochrome b subunit of formate dehydrogenase